MTRPPCLPAPTSPTTMVLRLAAWLLVPALLLLVGCAGRRPPLLEPLRRLEPKTPVVLIPGVSGTELVERETGRVLWGNARSVFLPRDGGYTVALPPHSDGAAPSALVAGGPVKAIRLFGVLRFEFYSKLIRLLEINGYRLGDLADPRPDDTFFIFPYDWRRGNVTAAAELGRLLENARRVRGDPVLRVHVICQSNAARIARYLVKYGGASLERAEAGEARPAPNLRVDKLILIGTDNGGALGVLRELNRGRRYVPLVGRRIRPESLFGMRGLYETLPRYRDDLFFDVEGRLLEVDLFDAESWRRYGWGIYGRAARRRIERSGRSDLFGDPERRAAFLADALDRAARLHALLRRDAAGFGGTRYYLIQNGYDETEERALLMRGKDGEWRTRFFDDGPVKRRPYLRALAAAPGDGHASLESQVWLSPQERSAIAHPPVYVPVPHRALIRSTVAQRRILDFLLDPGPAGITEGCLRGARAPGRGSRR